MLFAPNFLSWLPNLFRSIGEEDPDGGSKGEVGGQNKANKLTEIVFIAIQNIKSVAKGSPFFLLLFFLFFFPYNSEIKLKTLVAKQRVLLRFQLCHIHAVHGVHFALPIQNKLSIFVNITSKN